MYFNKESNQTICNYGAHASFFLIKFMKYEKIKKDYTVQIQLLGE